MRRSSKENRGSKTASIYRLNWEGRKAYTVWLRVPLKRDLHFSGNDRRLRSIGLRHLNDASAPDCALSTVRTISDENARSGLRNVTPGSSPRTSHDWSTRSYIGDNQEERRGLCGDACARRRVNEPGARPVPAGSRRKGAASTGAPASAPRTRGWVDKMGAPEQRFGTEGRRSALFLVATPQGLKRRESSR